MVNSPKSEVMEAGANLAQILNANGANVTFGKRSEGNTDLSTIINMAIDDMNSNQLTVEEKIPANSGYFKSYRFKWRDTYLSPDIDIPKDFLLKSVTLETCETDDDPVEGFVVGDKYIDFVVNVKEGTATNEHLYLNVNTFGSALSNAITFKILPFIPTNNMGIFGSGNKPYNYKYQNYINDVLENHNGIIGSINLHTYYGFDGFEDGTIYLLSRIGTFEQYTDYTTSEDEWGDCFYACIALYVPGMENTGLTKDGIVLESLMDTTLAFNYILKSKIVDNLTTDDATKILSAKQGKVLQDNKVDKETGKGLSSNDYTTTEKNKLAGIANNANNYTHPSVKMCDTEIEEIESDFYHNSSIEPFSSETDEYRTGYEFSICNSLVYNATDNKFYYTRGNAYVSGYDDEVATKKDIPKIKGTFTDLVNDLNNTYKEIYLNGENTYYKLVTLTKDYYYNSTIDSSLTNGVTLQNNIIIQGNGHTIDANSVRRIFNISNSSKIKLYDLTLQNGKAENGGAIYIASSNVEIHNCNIINNESTNNGGAIYAEYNTNLIITNSKINSNKTEYNGAGIYSYLFNGLYMRNTELNYNKTTIGNGGGYYENSGGFSSTIDIRDCIFKGNSVHSDSPSLSLYPAKTIYGCEIEGTNIGVTNKPYLTDHQSLSNYVEKSQTNGLLKNDGTVDTNTYITQHQSLKTINNESIVGTGNINISAGSNTDIVTSWESTPSDSKVPSEKLVKDNLDNKISKSNTSGLMKNDGTVDTTQYISQHQNLSNYIQKSSTSGLIKNDGTVDTNTYLTTHQDISGKIDTAGTGLSKSGTTLNHSNSVTAQTSTALKKIKYDAQGHITGTDSVAAGDLPSHTHNYATTSDVDTEIESYFNQINSQAGAYEYILNLVYPVGSIYMSVNSTNPAVLFGGSWTQLTDTFLYASTTADTSATTATAGEANHTLTKSEIPKHTHRINDWTIIVAAGGNTGQYTPNYSGNNWCIAKDDNDWSTRQTWDGSGNSGDLGNGAHNNMPPYMKVYMWKRTG